MIFIRTRHLNDLELEIRYRTPDAQSCRKTAQTCKRIASWTAEKGAGQPFRQCSYYQQMRGR